MTLIKTTEGRMPEGIFERSVDPEGLPMKSDKIRLRIDQRLNGDVKEGSNYQLVRIACTSSIVLFLETRNPSSHMIASLLRF